jgi:hypothetical protein
MNDRYVCTVEVSPDEVDAGADVTLTVRIACSRQDDLKQPSVSIRNGEDAELARAGFNELEGEDESEGEEYESDNIVLTAPRSAGEHVYRAVVVAAGKDGALQDKTSTEFRFPVKAHAAQLNVWDVPSAIEAGQRFSFMVGVRCSAGCNLGGRALSIVNHEGSPVGTAHLGHAIWPGTDALYVVEVEAQAPPAAGSYQWEVTTAPSSSELPHTAGSLAFGLKVVSPPDCEIAVEAIDKEKQTPIKGARVVMHPYRATTQEDGIAKLKVTRGQYDVLVSASKYVPVSMVLEVTADMITRAELDVDPPWDPLDEV